MFFNVSISKDNVPVAVTWQECLTPLIIDLIAQVLIFLNKLVKLQTERHLI